MMKLRTVGAFCLTVALLSALAPAIRAQEDQPLQNVTVNPTAANIDLGTHGANETADAEFTASATKPAGQTAADLQAQNVHTGLSFSWNTSKKKYNPANEHYEETNQGTVSTSVIEGQGILFNAPQATQKVKLEASFPDAGKYLVTLTLSIRPLS